MTLGTHRNPWANKPCDQWPWNNWRMPKSFTTIPFELTMPMSPRYSFFCTHTPNDRPHERISKVGTHHRLHLSPWFGKSRNSQPTCHTPWRTAQARWRSGNGSIRQKQPAMHRNAVNSCLTCTFASTDDSTTLETRSAASHSRSGPLPTLTRSPIIFSKPFTFTWVWRNQRRSVTWLKTFFLIVYWLFFSFFSFTGRRGSE